MLLTLPQKYLKDLLKDLGVLTKAQAEKLLRMKYPQKSHKNEIHQLLVMHEIYEQGQYLLDENGKIGREIISAIDVMLLISTRSIDIIRNGNRPFELTFFKFKGEKLWRYDICIVKSGTEIVVTTLLEKINAKYRVIIFVLDYPEQQKSIYVPCEFCFAWKENGEYHFYKETR